MKRINHAASIAAATLVLGAAATFGTSPTAHADGSVTLTGYGADSCAAPSTSQMSAFYSNTPFSYWGIYLGGSSRGCAQPNLTSSWVSTVTGQGWDLLPIWVGPQNPCGSGFSTYFSTDPATAYTQGKQEAKSAYAAWQTLSSDSDVPIEYDLEGVSGETDACRTAAKSFINGWVEQLHVAPAQPAGVYSSACGGNINDFASIANVPDFIDAADWDDDPNVNNISCVSASNWTGAKRHKQYQGDHDATYNGVTIKIDSRCSYAPVYGKADHVNTSHACVGGGTAVAAARATAATDTAAVDWHGASWTAGGPQSSQLRADGTPVRVTGVPLKLSEVSADAPTVGTPATLRDGSLMVPVTTHGRHAATRIYTTTDGTHFSLRSSVALRDSYPAGTAPATAVRADGSVTVLDARGRQTISWSPATERVSTVGTTGLPAAAQSLRFTGAASGRAVVETGACVTKTGCTPQSVTYLTKDAGRSWHRS